jgi:hypothetical protein
MRVFTIFLAFFLLATAVSGFAQFRNTELHQQYDSEQIITLRLTPEMFSDQLSLPQLSPLSPHGFDNIRILETKAAQAFLFVGSEILRNKFDPGFFTPAPFPRTVTEYNNAVRRQMFDAEPTSQQRNRMPLFRFN